MGDLLAAEHDGALAPALNAAGLVEVLAVLVDRERHDRVLRDVARRQRARARPEVERRAVVHEEERARVGCAGG